MSDDGRSEGNTALVTGASGQDGFYLTQRLLEEGWTVYATARRKARLATLFSGTTGVDRLNVIGLDIEDSEAVTALIKRVGPQEIYHLAGMTSVATSFSEPQLSWKINVDAVATILEAVRVDSLDSRVYQASSCEMFGYSPNESVVHDECSPLRPMSPYGAAKAAAHLLCQSYRQSYGLKVACGVLFNHESHRRPAGFLTRKIVDYVRGLVGREDGSKSSALELGNLKARRDWGFAPDYVDGIMRVMRQVSIRSERLAPEPDVATSYRDYVLGSGQTRAVWELVDRAFALAGIELIWYLEGDDPCLWNARFSTTGSPAVVVNPSFLRPNDPVAIQADPTLASRELGWTPNPDIDRFLSDMLFQDGK